MLQNFRHIWLLIFILSQSSCGGGSAGGSGGGLTDSNNTVETVVNPGTVPTANAGNSATYNGGETAMLNGKASTDPDGDPLRYTWTQTGGTQVRLSDRHAAHPLFTVPNVNDTLSFSLVVNDGYDNSSPSSVVINTVAYAGTRAVSLTQTPFRGSLALSDGGYNSNTLVSGNYLYRSAGINGLQIIDISDPVDLSQTGSMTLEQAHNVTRIDNVIYHVSHDAVFDNLHVYVTDVSNPVSPAFLGQVAGFSSTSIGQVTSAANVLYIGNSDSLKVYSVSNTSNPISSTSFKVSQPIPGPALDVIINGNYAYVAAGAAGLRIIDISNATAATPSISEAGFYVTPQDAIRVVVSGNYAYVATGTGGLVILNIANPASPKLVTTIPIPSGNTYGIRSVDVQANTLYLSADFDVWIYDVSSPATPAVSGRYRAGNLIRDVRVNGNYIYVSDSQGLRAIPVGKVSLPYGTSIYTSPDIIRDFIVYGDLGFVRMDNRVDILDVRNSNAPVYLSNYTVTGFENINGLAVVDNFAYLSQGTNSLKLLRFRNPAAPDIAKTLTIDANPLTILANDNYSYIYHNSFPFAKVTIFDLSNPFTPAARGMLASPYNTANWLRNLLLKDNILYMTEFNTSGTFRIADVSNPDSPIFTGSGFGPVDLYGMGVQDNYVMAIGNNTGVVSIDINNPNLPAIAGSGFPHQGYTLTIAASRAYANSDIVEGGIKILDVHNPLAPSLAGEFWPSSGANIPRVYGNTLYTVNSNSQLHYMEREPMLATRYISQLAGATSLYNVNWFDQANGQDRIVKCWVTGGSCSVGAINQISKTVTVSWTLPISAGDHEIRIAVGNGHYFGSTFDRVTVQ